VLITQTTSHIQNTLRHAGVPHGRASEIGHTVATASGPIHGGSGGIPSRIVHAVALDFAHATQTVVLLMAVVMAVGFVVAAITMPRTRAADQADEQADDTPAAEFSIPAASRR
jgi:hypothetical protein